MRFLNLIIYVLVLAPPVLLAVRLSVARKGAKLDLNSPIHFLLLSLITRRHCNQVNFRPCRLLAYLDLLAALRRLLNGLHGPHSGLKTKFPGDTWLGFEDLTFDPVGLLIHLVKKFLSTNVVEYPNNDYLAVGVCPSINLLVT